MADIYPKRFLHQGFTRVRKASCFVLMPFDTAFDDVFAALRKTLQSPALNLVCRRADDVRTPNILETILRGIAQSEYVLADVTGSNPNVFHELGIAHCTKDAEAVVLLAQSLESVPFDLRHLRCIQYEPTADGLVALRKALAATFQEVARDSFRFRVREGKRFVFGRKLVGSNNDLFELTFECPHVGHDAVKILIHFREYAIDRQTGAVDSQFLFLSDDHPIVRVKNIPWYLHLAQCSNEDALLVLEKE